MKIHRLSQAVISAIAAGEVIERPAVVVKELLENAVDAGATQIEIEIQDEKHKKIRVTDNGSGISAEDLPLAVERHSTSKLHDVEELPHLLSLGFRGEALASIAHVSKLLIRSRAADMEVGNQLLVENGNVEEVQPVGLPPGTTVLVSDIFGQLPARKKFLKSPLTEFRQITEYVTAAALSHPEIAFTLIHNQKHIFDLTAGTAAQRAKNVLGADQFSKLIPIEFGQPHFSITGFIGTPQIARRSKQKQYLFVNHRSVSPSDIQRWVKESYGSLIEPRSEPYFILFLDVPPAMVDINVHPRKETVRFLEEKEMKEFVVTAIKKTLEQSDLTYQYQPIQTTEWELRDSVQLVESADRKASSATESVLKQLVEPWKVLEEKPIILQLDFTYLITLTKQGLIIIDQHAAHERILYNQFLSAMKKQNELTDQHIFSKAFTLTLPASEANVLEEHLSTLQEVGFDIETFGQHTFKISAVPKALADRVIPQLINELVGDLIDGKSVKEVDSVAQRTIAYLACRSAVQAGDVLTESQRQLLFEKLSETDQSFTCPHGRPTTITFSISDLEKLFHRR